VAGFDADGTMVCGYIILRSPPYTRTIERVPPEERDRVFSVLEGAPRGSILEITAVWVDEAFRSGMASVTLWRALIADVKEFKAEHILYTTHKERTRTLYAFAESRLLHRRLIALGGEQVDLSFFHTTPSTLERSVVTALEG
jgi:hypothetical protein